MTVDVCSPPPVTALSGDGLPAYLSNGVVGLRVRTMPLQPGVAMLNGLAAVHRDLGVEYSPYAPYPLAGDVAIDGIHLSDVPDRVRLDGQRYDFTAGELTTDLRVELDRGTVHLHIVTFASRTHASLVLQEVSVHVDHACALQMTSFVSTDGIAGDLVSRASPVAGPDGDVADGCLVFATPDRYSSSGVALGTEMTGATARSYLPRANGDLAVTYTVDATAHSTYRLRQVASMVPSSAHAQPDRQAVRLLQHGRDLGFDELRRRNRVAWDELWRGRLVLGGAGADWQARADAAFFYLHSSAHVASVSSTSMFGMARWHDYHYYYGHVMWDIEAFAVPPLLLGQPDAAAALLDYRLRTLPAAAANARLHGRRGLQFAWESGPRHGEEASPLGGNGPNYEDHVSMVVAHAFGLHAAVTGDPVFLAERAWPVLAGVATWLTSRVVRTGRGYEIPRSIGVAEREQPGDNSAFVNLSAVAVLREAVAVARHLGHVVPDGWGRIADGLVVPVDGRRVIVDHDGFRDDEEKAATPAALAALTLFGTAVADDVRRATRQYYLRRADEYVGSPMLSSLLGLWAAEEGAPELSAALFDEGYAKFCDTRFANVHEYRPDRFPDEPVAGPFYANLGGFLLACTYGLTHLRPTLGPVDSWCDDEPVVLPAGWDAVGVERVWARGEPYALEAVAGRPTRLTRTDA